MNHMPGLEARSASFNLTAVSERALTGADASVSPTGREADADVGSKDKEAEFLFQAGKIPGRS